MSHEILRCNLLNLYYQVCDLHYHVMTVHRVLTMGPGKTAWPFWQMSLMQIEIGVLGFETHTFSFGDSHRTGNHRWLLSEYVRLLLLHQYRQFPPIGVEGRKKVFAFAQSPCILLIICFQIMQKEYCPQTSQNS